MEKNFYLKYLTLSILTALLQLLFFSPSLAQVKKPISGNVIDSLTNAPVQFATVAVQDENGKILDGTTCDDQGNFVMDNAPNGKFNLAISFVGYKTRIIPVDLTTAQQQIGTGTIILSPDNKSLDEVVIRSTKPMVEETEDGYVYDAENDLNASGGTASDLMRNVPGLSLDMDGNVEMQGSNKIKILIDGKPSAIMAGNVAEALKQIPANMIQKVEVITTPSAKYDAEGSGGVINIITKKNSTLQGYRGGMSITGGNRSNNINANLTSRINKVGLRGSLGANLNRNFGNGNNEQLYYAQRQVAQTNRYSSEGQGLNGMLGGDIDFNSKNSLSATLRFSQYRSISDRSSVTIATSTLPENFGNLISHDRNLTDSKNGSGSLDANLDFTRKFKRKGQELNMLMLYTRNNRDGGNYTVRRNQDEIVNQRQQNDNDASNDEITLKADYTQPLKKWGRLEVGGKAIMRNNISSYQLATASTSEAPLQTDPRRTNLFSYDQDVFSSYLSYSIQLKKKYNFRLGGRYEHTNIFANFVSNDTTLRKPYRTFMPNIMTSILMKHSQRLSLGYSTQIFRPQIEYLNPYLDDSNERYIRIGNPNLSPEITHNLQLTYSKYLKTITVNSSLYYRQTNDNIGQYRTSNRVRSRFADNDDNPANDSIDAITTTYLNLGSNLTYGTNLSVTGRIGKTAQLGTNVSLYYNEINGYLYSNQLKQGVPVTKGGWMYSIKLNGSYQVPRDYKGPFRDMSAQFNTSLNSPRINLQGRSTSFQQYSLSIKKEFMVRQQSKDKVSLNLSIENFFNKGNRIRTTTVTEQFTSTSIQNQYNRIFRLGLTYNFSRMEYKIKPEKPEKPLQNEDRKKIDIGEVNEIKVDGQDGSKGDRKAKVPAKPISKSKKP
jgi:hypothetical protein